MILYSSFLIIDPKHSNIVKSLHSSQWCIQLCNDPSRRFWFCENGCRVVEHPSAIGKFFAKGEMPGKLIQIVAEETHHAHNVIQLVCALHDVIEGNPSQRIGTRFGVEMLQDDTAEQRLFQAARYFERFVYRPEFPLAMVAATSAWESRNLIYAIHKLAQSYSTESVTWWSLHPAFGQTFDRTSELHASHVTSSIAINLAFSAIEELQLQIKSDSKNKRWTNNVTGEWNPKVLEDVERRLVAAGVDPTQEITWYIRGSVTLTEAEIKPALGRFEPYADGQVVRDIKLTIPEALHICSLLRNFHTAHAFGEASASIGPYEVHNVQAVARHLILKKCGIWNLWTNDIAERHA